MTHSLTIYRGKRLLTALLFVILTLFPVNMFISVHYLNALSAGIGSVLIIPISIMIGLIFSKKTIEIVLDDFKIQFENTSILLSDIKGYYINRKSPILSQIEFKDIYNNNYRFSSLNFGQKGKDFELFISDLFEKVKKSNKEFSELSFYDFHGKQYKFFRIAIYEVMVVTILLNLVYFYLIIFKNVAFDWRLLFINFLFLGMYNFHKKNERMIKNKKAITKKD